MPKLTLHWKDERTLEAESGATLGDILRKEMDDAFGRVVAVRYNGRAVDIAHPVSEDGDVVPILIDSKEGLEILRHSTSHIMAEAVQSLFPEVKVTIGPAIEDGFYYDFEKPTPFVPEDLPRIEARMREIVDGRAPFTRQEMTREAAVEFFEKLKEPYKVELLKGTGNRQRFAVSSG